MTMGGSRDYRGVVAIGFVTIVHYDYREIVTLRDL